MLSDYIRKYVKEESKRQSDELCLIASENVASDDVLMLMSTCLNNKYAEGYPGKRYYGGCKNVDKIEQYAIDLACMLFKSNYANVQPHSGASANLAVYFALLNPGDTILGMSLDAGGHLTHGHPKVTISGKWFNSVQYGLTEDGDIDYEDIENKLYKYNPKLLVVGASAFSKFIDYKRIKQIVDAYNKDKPLLVKREKVDIGTRSIYNWEETIDKCYVMVDMAHVAGLVAAGLHPNPVPYADVVTTTTHKTLRGPRGGLILCNDEEIAKKIDKAVFPGCQGGPLEHVIAAKAQCLYEASQLEFVEYCTNVIKNMSVMCQVLLSEGFDVVSNGTENHLMLLDLRNFDITGAEAESRLSKVGIVVNKNKIWNDPRSAKETSGIRLGTANITTRGADKTFCRELALIISEILHMNSKDFEESLNDYKNRVLVMARSLKPIS